jgi:hypothetical protein
MKIYTETEIQKQFLTLLKKALSEGQIKFKTRDGRVFVIRPDIPARKSPFEVRSIKLPITRADILEAIRDGRERYSQ